MEELIRFVTLARGGQFTITDLSELFCISRCGRGAAGGD